MKRRCLQINKIERNIYVRGEAITEPIDYVRLTNALPIIFHFRDFDIPAGATAQAFCMVADGTGTQTDATISGNDVTIPVQKTMFSVLGHAALQVKITSGDDELVNFVCPVFVKPNYTEGDFPPSENTGGFFDEAKEILEDAETAVNAANSAAQSANQAAQSANQAAQEAENAAASITPDALKNAVGDYFDDNPIEIDDPFLDVDTLRFAYITTPELEDDTLTFPIGSDPSAVLASDVEELKSFAEQFNGKTLYTT